MISTNTLVPILLFEFQILEYSVADLFNFERGFDKNTSPAWVEDQKRSSCTQLFQSFLTSRYKFSHYHNMHTLFIVPLLVFTVFFEP